MSQKIKIQLLVWGSVVVIALLAFMTSPTLTVLNVGLIAGITGVSILWWQAVLGVRQLATLFTKDLHTVNAIHSGLGKYGFLLILLHPIAINATYGVPPTSSFPAREVFVTVGLVAFILMAVVWFTSAVFRNRLQWRWWKRIHLVAYVAIGFVFLHSSQMGNILERGSLLSDALKVVWYTLAITFGLIVVYRLLLWFGLLKSTYIITDKNQVTTDVTQYVLSHKSGKRLDPIEGQFAYVQANRLSESHPFTVSNFDEESGDITFSIKNSGTFTAKLSGDSKEGDRIFIDGPYGIFTEGLDSNGPAVMIAGGIGITPFLRWILHGRVHALFYANRTLEDIAYKKLVNKKTKTTHVLSGEKKRNYLHGYVTAELIEDELGHDLGRFTFYVCGPAPMMDAITQELVEHGVRASKIKTERFSL